MINKKFLYIILISVIGSITLQAQQSEYCHNKIFELGDVQCGEWISESATITYWECPINIGYSKRICIVDDPNDQCPPRTVFQIGIGSVNWNWDNCPTLTRILFPGYPENFGQLMEDFFAIMIAQLSRELANIAYSDWYNGLTSEEKQLYNCNGTPPSDCTIPECAPFEVLISNPPCNIPCWGIKNPGTSGPDIRMVWLPCDDNNLTCCFSSMKYCMCGNNIMSETVLGGGNYTFCTPPIVPPQPGCVMWEDYNMFTLPHCMVMCP